MMLICGTLLLLTALTNWAPFLMRPARSVLRPTIKPVTLWRKIIGVDLGGRESGLKCYFCDVDIDIDRMCKKILLTLDCRDG